MAFFSDDWLDEVRQRSDLVEIVSEHVQLKQNGRRYIGLCPFHGEKTPSFSVDAEKQLYYCFGCHAGGNVFRFVMAMETMDFPEAARHLAEKANIPIPEADERDKGPSREVRDRLYAALTEAARWYNRRLYAPQGARALEYLHGRGLGDNTIRRFGLGATGDGWENLTDALTGMGFTRRELEDANLVAVRGDKSYDMFRSRAMFPIFDARGKVVAFGGRILGEGQPKYLNSSDTPVFSKSRTVYGLNFIKGGGGTLFLLEGYMDVVSLAQHGVQGGVASLGTALTPDQVRLIKRRAGDNGEIVIVYDGDAAGQRAIRRAIDLFAMQAVPAKIVVVPDGQDPDDFVRQYGGRAFLELPRKSPPDYLLDREREAVDLGSLDGRTAYAKEAARILRTIESPVEVDNYVKRLSVETGFGRDVLYEQIGRTPKMRLSAEPAGGPRRPRADAPDREPDHVKAEKHLLAMIAGGADAAEFHLTAEDFSDPLCAEVAEALLGAAGDPMAASRLLDGVDDEQKRAGIGAILASEKEADPEAAGRQMRDCVARIRLRQLDAQIAELAERIAAAGDIRDNIALIQRQEQLLKAHAQLRASIQ